VRCRGDLAVIAARNGPEDLYDAENGGHVIPNRAPNPARVSWIMRGGLLAAGVAICWVGISIAADVGEILVAAPLLFLGAFAIGYATTGHLPRRRL
jgi:hypothetical protein